MADHPVLHEGWWQKRRTVPMSTCLLPKRPPETLSVTLPVGGGVPEPLTVRFRSPRQLGKVKPARMQRKSAHAPV